MSNYTSQMVARINAEAPLNLAKAKALAEEFGKRFRFGEVKRRFRVDASDHLRSVVRHKQSSFLVN